MAYETIKYEVEEQILTITLNRPDKLNAFNGTMQQELIDAFDAADKDDNVRAIIVTGAGRGFCAGADLSSGASTFDRDARRGPVKRLASGAVDYSDPQVRDGGGQVTLRIFKCLKPVIAAVNGPAVGIGVTMQLAMDIRIASEAARFGFVFSQRGIVPEAASSWFLPRIVGISQALEWCYSVIEAATLAGIHQMVLRFPQGYDTPLGPGGLGLSGGQKQRIALARALYGKPALVVLDEPNSNLDDAGESALVAAIDALRKHGSTVILVTHRPSVLAVVDKLLVLQDGTQKMFGPRDQVLKALLPTGQQPSTAPSTQTS